MREDMGVIGVGPASSWVCDGGERRLYRVPGGVDTQDDADARHGFGADDGTGVAMREEGAGMARASDIQVGGNHYKSMEIQPVDFIHANGIPYLEGNVIKYVCRHLNKGGVEDLRKAKHYIDLVLEKVYEVDRG